MTVWDIEITPAGTFDIKKNRRAFAYDRDDLDECIRAIKRSRFYDPDDTVLLYDPQGHRSPVRMH